MDPIMDAPRTCPRCDGLLEAAPLLFTLAYCCNGCGLLLCRAQHVERVVEELAALRGKARTSSVLELGQVVRELEQKRAA